MTSPAKPFPARGGSKGNKAGAAAGSSIWEQPLFAQPWLRFVGALLLVTLGITAWKWDVIDSPPYYDFATGLFVEATFLVESNFDYGALVDQPRWMSGGPAVYVVSIVPTILAVMMKVLPTARSVLIAYHVATFLCTALVLVLMYLLLAPRVGRVGAVLAPAALFTAPIFSAQVDMLGMDLPLATCSLACLACFSRQRYLAGGFFCLLAVAIKATGAVLVVSAFATCVLVLIFSYLARDAASRRGYWAGAILIGVAAALLALSQNYLNSLEGSATENWIDFGDDLRQGLFSQRTLLDWCPDQVVLLVVALVATHFAFRNWLATSFSAAGEESAMRRLWIAAHDSLRDRPLLVFSWLMIASLAAAFASTYSLPRYLTISLPFLYLILGATLFAPVAWRQWVTAAFALLIGFNLLNADGRMFPKFDSQGRTGALLERSREYLADHRSNIEAVEVLAALPASTTIVAGNPFVHFLSLPRLGYVDRPRGGYALNTFTSTTFQSGLSLPEDTPRDVVFVYVESAQTPGGAIPLPEASPGNAVEVLYNDRQEHPLVVYRRTWDPAVSTDDLGFWYRGLLLPQLNLFGQAQTLADAGRLDEAAALFEQVVEQDPNDAAARLGLGRVLVNLKQQERALEQFQEAARLDPENSEAHQLLGTMLAASALYDEATAELLQAVKLDAENWEAHYALGKAYERQRKFAEAALAYTEAVRIKPEMAQYRYDVGNALLMQGKYTEAVAALREALRLRPAWPDAANSLGWILATSEDQQLRDGAEAVELLEAARENAQPESAELVGLLDTMAAAYAEVGRFEEATKTQQEAIDLTKKLGIDQLLPGMEIRLKLYESKEPYHEGSPPTP